MTNGNSTLAASAEAGASTEPRRNDAASATSSAATATEEVSALYHAVDFRVHVSMRYHQARRAWWTGLNRLSSAAAALAGSAAVIAVFGRGGNPIWVWVSGFSGAFAALNAALGFADRAREHATLYDKFSSVAARMAKEAKRDDECGRNYNSEVLLLEASEPPVIQSLNVFCHNQECEARGYSPEHLRSLGFWNRVFKSWFTVFDDFPPRDQQPASADDVPRGA